MEALKQLEKKLANQINNNLSAAMLKRKYAKILFSIFILLWVIVTVIGIPFIIDIILQKYSQYDYGMIAPSIYLVISILIVIGTRYSYKMKLASQEKEETIYDLIENQLFISSLFVISFILGSLGIAFAYYLDTK